MYEQFFGLSENPFSLTPDPRFIYSSKSHDEALAHLRYWVEHREGFAMITGEVGTGKTTALFSLIEGMARQYEIAFITNSTLAPVELLEEICRKFRIDLQGDLSKPTLLQKLETALLRLRDMEHGAVLIIDEAQNFDHSLLEEVRLLSNITRPGGPPLLQIALVGQPELERKLSLPELRQLRQRIGVHYRIEPLSEAETTSYIHHRVQVAGGYPRVLFPPETIKMLYQKTHGLPREINQVASQSLLGAYVEDSTTVRTDHIHSAIQEMNFKSVLDRGMTLTVTPPPPSDIQAERGAAAVGRTREMLPVEPSPSPPPTLKAAGTLLSPTSQAPASGATSPAPAQPAAAIPRVPASRRFDPVLPVGAQDPVQYAPEKKGPGRFVLLLGALVIISIAVYLAFAPKPEKGDDIAQLAAEGTIPKVPASTLTGRPAGELEHQQTSKVPSAGPPPSAGSVIGTTAGGTATSGTAPPVTGPEVKPADAPAPAPVPPPVDDANGAFRLQVASLRDSATALTVGRLAEKLTERGFTVNRSRQGELTWYAVLVGPYATREAAEEAKVRLGELDRQFIDALVREQR